VTRHENGKRVFIVVGDESAEQCCVGKPHHARARKQPVDLTQGFAESRLDHEAKTPDDSYPYHD